MIESTHATTVGKGDFRKTIEDLITRVPTGCVTTYGDLAGIAGQASASRVVGGIAHYGDQTLPWHRVVNRWGGLASGFHGGRLAQAKLLEVEGVSCTDNIVDGFKDIRWNPDFL